MKTSQWYLDPRPSAGVRIVAMVLRVSGHGLARLARLLQRKAQPPQHRAVLEFYAEAGAPEGALYVDGRLVGHLPGINRL